jgi:cryptochrome
MSTGIWFRKNLRVHDNAALTKACDDESVLPLYCLDPAWATPVVVGPNRCRFLIESLEDLDQTLRSRYGSRLHVIVGDPSETITKLIRDGTITKVVFEEEVAEPRELELEKRVLEKHPHEAFSVPSTHLLYDADAALSKGAPPTKMPGMVTLAGKLGAPAKPLMAPSSLPPRPAIDTPPLPSLESLGYASVTTNAAYGVQGGESNGLTRLQEQMEREDGNWARGFEKPQTTSASFEAPSQRPFPSISQLEVASTPSS